jgi:aldehyde dehydrogenase (NAD+)
VAATETRGFQNFIGGEWVDAASGETFESTSPATGEPIGTFPRSGPDDVDRAVEAAKAAYEEWRLVPAPARGEILYGFGALVREHKDELALLMSREMGKVLPEAGGDVQEAIDMSFYMAGEGRRLFGQTTPSELRDKFNMSVRMPIGVIGVITPWNFPIAIPSWKIAPALVCGNTVVFKPATDTPALGERFVELLVEAGVPSGVVNVVHGGGGAVGERLVRHPGRTGDHADRLARDGRGGDARGGGQPQARPPRARRQERGDRPGRRRSGPRRRRDHLVGVRHLGPAMAPPRAA